MTKDENYFYNKYPKIFPHPPRCGFDLPHGWEDLVDELCAELSRLENPPACAQVKEKYAGLRFYLESCDDEADKIIDKYEAKSYLTCQICGSTDQVKQHGYGWISSLCLNCRIKKSGPPDNND